MAKIRGRIPKESSGGYALKISWHLKHGFTHKATVVRNIPNKRMPKKNSPSNVAGETSTTMHEENIVICQRTTYT